MEEEALSTCRVKVDRREEENEKKKKRYDKLREEGRKVEAGVCPLILRR